MFEKMKFGERLRRIRKSKGLNQADFAQIMNASRTSISRYEAGDQVPDVATAASLCNALGVNGHWLLTGDGTMLVDDEVERMMDTRHECDSSTDSAYWKEQALRFSRELELLKPFDKWSLSELALVMRLGKQQGLWDVTRVLARKHPEAMAASEVQKVLASQDKYMSEDDLMGHLLVLKRQDVVSEVQIAGVIGYCLSQGIAEFRAWDLGDVTQHARDAVTLLIKRVLPAVERQNKTGHLLTVTGNITRENANSLIHELKTEVKERCRQRIQMDGSEPLVVVLGVAIDGETG